MLPRAFAQTRFLGVAAGALIVLTLAVDLAGLRPAAARMRRLETRRAELAARLVAQSEQEREIEFLASVLGAGSPGESAGALADPIAIVDGFIAHRGLERTELVSKPIEETGQVARARLSTVVRGSFAQIVGLVRDLEQSPRVITIDGLSIEAPPGAARLEGRLSLSVYGPKRGSGP
jgi:Tfp pilus assembly protein PilO